MSQFMVLLQIMKGLELARRWLWQNLTYYANKVWIRTCTEVVMTTIKVLFQIIFGLERVRKWS